MNGTKKQKKAQLAHIFLFFQGTNKSETGSLKMQVNKTTVDTANEKKMNKNC